MPLGPAGMPRRYPDYPDVSGWNSVVSYGSLFTTVGAALFFYILHDFHCRREGER